MRIKRIREDNATNAAIEVMADNADNNTPYVGSFWYDNISNELYGVNKAESDRFAFSKSASFRSNVKTTSKLHKDIWKKETLRNRDKRFTGDYTLKYRGRVFEFEDQGFVVYTGDWINKFPEAKAEIIDEFELPDDVTFKTDYHWDIGHGWSDEVI